MITIFYDGACGLCSKEINYYRKIAPDDVFNWQDVTVSTAELEQQGISLTDALMQLHAIDHEGRLHQGVDAFILVWKPIGPWKWLAYLIGLPIIKQTAQFLYRNFCRWRFNRLPHCQIAAQRVGHS